MYIEKEKWKKFKEIFSNLFWDYDRVSQGGKNILTKLDKLISNIEKDIDTEEEYEL